MNSTPRPGQPSRSKRNTPRLRARALTACCGLALVLGSTGVARADTAPEDVDARLAGYPGSTAIKGGTAPTWLLLIALSIVGCSVLFKNAKRTHLD